MKGKVGLVLLIVLAIGFARIVTQSANNQVVLDLTSDGVLISPQGQKTATAYLKGSVEGNRVKLEGKIMVDGREYPIELEGKARKVFIGWDVPKGAKPKKVNLSGKTRIVYEGARKMYAVLLKLEGDGFKLGGEFFEDGHGGLGGTAVIDGEECKIGLRGNSSGLFERVTLEESASMNPS